MPDNFRATVSTARSLLLFLLLFLFISTGCNRQKPLEPEPGEELSGGDTTVFDVTENAFGFSARNLPFEKRSHFFVGNSFFKQNWVEAPSSTKARDGIGPLFNTRSCSACHPKDGRGQPPPLSEPALSLLARLSIPGTDPRQGIVPEPTYGDQLQTAAVPGARPEGSLTVTFEEIQGHYADGTPYSLRKPRYHITDLAHGPLHPDTLISPRVAPSLIGLGLLEAVPEEDILALADPDDSDGDGISGRPNWVWDIQQEKRVLGRFGWKANQPTVHQQTAGAFHGDMGITSSLFPDHGHTSKAQHYDAFPNGGDPEIDDEILDKVVFYSRTLAVPARRNWQNPDVLRGKQLFHQLQCTTCHVPQLTTGDVPDLPELSNQRIRPYTDLLLHDMGPALADNRPDYEATGSEWRTPPLWGAGLQQTVSGHTTFLHDGRARNFAEAILWHGGEAEKAKENFKSLPRTDRSALIQFLESL